MVELVKLTNKCKSWCVPVAENMYFLRLVMRIPLKFASRPFGLESFSSNFMWLLVIILPFGKACNIDVQYLIPCRSLYHIHQYSIVEHIFDGAFVFTVQVCIITQRSHVTWQAIWLVNCELSYFCCITMLHDGPSLTPLTPCSPDFVRNLKIWIDMVVYNQWICFPKAVLSSLKSANYCHLLPFIAIYCHLLPFIDQNPMLILLL